MSEPKKQELANLQTQTSLSLVSAARLAKLVQKPAEETLVVHNTVIHCTESGLYSLNDLHRASGADDSKRPYAFLRTKVAQDFIEALKAEGVENSYETVTGGANPGTYANKLLAYEYATYLDRAFRLKAMIVLDRVTTSQVEQIQVAYKAVVEELGEEQAKLLETVEELGNAYQSLNREKFLNSELVNSYRSVKHLGKNSPVLHELGLAKRNVRLMMNNVKDVQSVLTNIYDVMQSIVFSLEAEMRLQPTNKYYTKLLYEKVIDPLKAEFADIKDQLDCNAKLLEDGEQYMANATNIVSPDVLKDKGV